MKVFENFLDKPQFSAVLQFYAGFTQLANEGVQEVILDSNFSSLTGSLLTLIRCFFEAEVDDLSLYEAIIFRLDKTLNLSNVTMSPFDCMSVGYFLAFGFMAIASGKLSVDLSSCGTDDHLLNLLLEKLSKHGMPGAFHKFKMFNLSGNKIGDKGIAHIATALQEKKITIETLDCCDCGISSAGVKLLAKTLAAKHSLKVLKIRRNRIGNAGVTHIAKALKTNATLKTVDVRRCEISNPGLISLAKGVAANSSLEEMCITHNQVDDGSMAHVATALEECSSCFKSLEVGGVDVTDKGAELLIEAALSANTSIVYMWLDWSSTHPDSIPKKMVEYVNNSNLETLVLHMRSKLQSTINHAHAHERMISEWYTSAVQGVVELVQSLVASKLKKLFFLAETKNFTLSESFPRREIFEKLDLVDEAALKVNLRRSERGLPEIMIDYACKLP